MRIAYLTLQAPREGEAAYVHVQEMIEGLRCLGNTVELFAPSYSSVWEKPIFIVRMVEHVLIQIRLARRLRHFHVLYVRAHFMALPIALLAVVTGVPVVHEVNGPNEDVLISYPLAAPFRRMLQWMQQTQYKYAKGLIAVTPQLKDWLNGQFEHVPVVVISNGANLQYFNPQRSPVPDLPRPYAVFVGSLAPWHGIRMLVDAAEDADWPHGVSVVIVGDGPERETVQRAAERNPRLVVLGRRPYASIGSIIVGAAVGLVTISDPGKRSRTGLAPIKLFELLACGVPAIVSDLPGQAELVRTHQCGIVYPHDDAQALARAVAEVTSNPDMARMMGERGRQLVEKEFSWKILAERTERFLLEVVPEPGVVA